MSMFLLTAAIGSALNFALIPVTVNPKLLWMYGSLAIVAAVTGIIFFMVFRKEDRTEHDVNQNEGQKESESVDT